MWHARRKHPKRIHVPLGQVEDEPLVYPITHLVWTLIGTFFDFYIFIDSSMSYPYRLPLFIILLPLLLLSWIPRLQLIGIDISVSTLRFLWFFDYRSFMLFSAPFFRLFLALFVQLYIPNSYIKIFTSYGDVGKIDYFVYVFLYTFALFLSAFSPFFLFRWLWARWPMSMYGLIIMMFISWVWSVIFYIRILSCLITNRLNDSIKEQNLSILEIWSKISEYSFRYVVVGLIILFFLPVIVYIWLWDNVRSDILYWLNIVSFVIALYLLIRIWTK